MFRKFITFSAGLYASTILAALVRVGLKSLIAKTIGKEGLGTYAYFVSLTTIGSSVLAFGLGRVLTKHVAADQRNGNHGRLVAAVMSGLVAISILLTLIAGVGLPYLWAANPVYFFVLIALGPMVLFQMGRAVLRGYLDRNREAIAALAAGGVRLVLVSLTVLLMGTAISPVVGLLATYLLLAAGMLLYLGFRYPGQWSKWPHAIRDPEVRQLLALAVPLWMTDVMAIVGRQADRVIVQGKLGYSSLAEYSAAFTFINLLDQPLSVMSRMFLVTFASGFYNSAEQYKVISAVNLAFITCIGLLASILAVPLTPLLFTGEYKAVATLTAILSVAFVFKSVEMLNTAQTIVIDYPQANRNAKAWTVAAYLPTAYLLTRYFGIIGAAISYVFSAACYAFVHAMFMKRRLPRHATCTLNKMVWGLVLYSVTLGVLLLLPNIYLGLMLIPAYLAAGHLFHLWDMVEFGRLAKRLLHRHTMGDALQALIPPSR